MNGAAEPLRRVIIEMGMGTALHSGDYTKAAKRAVENALYSSSLTMFRSLSMDPNSMQIELTIGAQEPEKVDLDAVAQLVPFGRAETRATKGGLNVVDETSGRPCVLVNAGVIVRLRL